MDSRQLQLKQKIVSHSMSDTAQAQINRQDELQQQQLRQQQLAQMDGMMLGSLMQSELRQFNAQEKEKEDTAKLYARPVQDLSTKEGRDRAKEIAENKQLLIEEAEKDEKEKKKSAGDEAVTSELWEDAIIQAETAEQRKNGVDYTNENTGEKSHIAGIVEQYQKELDYQAGKLSEEEKKDTIGYKISILQEQILQKSQTGEATKLEEKQLRFYEQRLRHMKTDADNLKNTTTASPKDIERARKLKAFMPIGEKRFGIHKLTKKSEIEQRFLANLAMNSSFVIIANMRDEMAELSVSMDEFAPDYILENYSDIKEKLEKMSKWVDFFSGEELEKLPANEQARVNAFAQIVNYGSALVTGVLENYGLVKKEGKFEETAIPHEGLQQEIEENRAKLADVIENQLSSEVDSIADSLAVQNMEKYKNADTYSKASAKFAGLILIEQAQRDTFAKFEDMVTSHKDILADEAKSAQVERLRKELYEVLETQTALINEIEAISLFESEYRNLAASDVEELKARQELLVADAKAQDEAEAAAKLEEKQQEGEQEVREAVEQKDKQAGKEADKGHGADEEVEDGPNVAAVRKEIDAVETKVRDGNNVELLTTQDGALIKLFNRIDRRKAQLAGLKKRAEVLIKGVSYVALGKELVKLQNDELRVLSQVNVGKEEYEERLKADMEEAVSAEMLKASKEADFKEFVTSRIEGGEELYSKLPYNILALHRFFNKDDVIRSEVFKVYFEAYQNHIKATSQQDADKIADAETEMKNALMYIATDVVEELGKIDIKAYSESKGVYDAKVENAKIMAEGLSGLMNLTRSAMSDAEGVIQKAEDKEWLDTLTKDYLADGKAMQYSALVSMGDLYKFKRICEAYESGAIDEVKKGMLSDADYKDAAAWSGTYYYKENEATDQKTTRQLGPDQVYAYAKYRMAMASQIAYQSRLRYFKENADSVSHVKAAIKDAGKIGGKQDKTTLSAELAGLVSKEEDKVDLSALLKQYGELETDVEISMLERMVVGDNDEALFDINNDLIRYDKEMQFINSAVVMVTGKTVGKQDSKSKGVFADVKEMINYQGIIGMKEGDKYRDMLVDLTAEQTLQDDASEEKKMQAKEKRKSGAATFLASIRDYYSDMETAQGLEIPPLAYVVSHLDEYSKMLTRTMQDQKMIETLGLINEESAKEDKLLNARVNYYCNLFKYLYTVVGNELARAMASELPEGIQDIATSRSKLEASLEELRKQKE